MRIVSVPTYRTSLRVALLLLLALISPAFAADPGPSGLQFGAPMLTAPPRQPMAPQAPRRSAEANSASYDRCMKQAREDPAAARKFAQSWFDRDGGHPAEHCLAVALIGLQQYKDAASRLEALAQAMVRAPATLRAGVLGQAAQAWLLFGDPERAYAADSSALTLRPDDLDLLVDRAAAAGSAGWFDKAIADLDRVLQIDPKRLDALIYRASAQRAEGRLDPALVDIDAALKLAPDSVQALLERGNIRGSRGDLDGAQADWRRVSAMAPGSDAATSAKKNIERLNAGVTLPPMTPGKPR
jgi:tetratricopeptide (TPR) repeat protein